MDASLDGGVSHIIFAQCDLELDFLPHFYNNHVQRISPIFFRKKSKIRRVDASWDVGVTIIILGSL